MSRKDLNSAEIKGMHLAEIDTLLRSEMARNVHDSLYNWIVDETTTLENIITVLKEIKPEDSDIDVLVALTCLEGIAKKQPVSVWKYNVIEGSMEEVISIIISSSSISTFGLMCEMLGFISLKCIKEWLCVYISPKQCPNPCLRLELYRLMDGLQVKGTDVSCENFISTLFELSDHFPSLKNKGMVKCSASDLKGIMMSHSLNMKVIFESDYPKQYEERIIVALVKITNLFAISLEKDMQIQGKTNEDEVLSSLEFCGLFVSLEDHQITLKIMDRFAHIICNSSLLRKYVTNILILTKAAVSDIKKRERQNNNRDTPEVVAEIWEMLSALISAEVRLVPQRLHCLPKYINARELNGLTKPIAHHMFYFSLFKNRYYSKVDTQFYSEWHRGSTSHYLEYAYLQEQSKYDNFTESESSYYETSESSEDEGSESFENEGSTHSENEGSESSGNEDNESWGNIRSESSGNERSGSSDDGVSESPENERRESSVNEGSES